MPEKNSSTSKDKRAKHGGITRITVRGYKSLSKEQSIEIRPLTVLAGANSSGKSSIMQPLLLMKQTLEASFDPGALLLDGPNLRFTIADQLLSRSGKGTRARTFSVGLEAWGASRLEVDFTKERNKGLEVTRTKYVAAGNELELRPGMSSDDIKNQELINFRSPDFEGASLSVVRDRCFLRAALGFPEEEPLSVRFLNYSPLSVENANLERHIIEAIHLPGLRGNPLRNYPVSAVGARFPGTFERYAASVIAHWQSERETETLEKLFSDLKTLGLTWKVTARQIDETQVELQVGRLPRAAQGGAHDLVNIADVGLGVSQTLPVLVALLVARPGQLVYLEQPEIHLHPRAQTALAQVIADAAKRGVRVVIETHSDLLLLGIRTLVAEGRLPAGDVKLHWFQRSEDGVTKVTSADLDESGTFGDWPEDFAEVTLSAQGRFLDAAEVGAGTE
jgi:predicted ATPase